VLRLVDTWLLRQLRSRFHAAPIERAVVAYARLGDNAMLWYAIAAAGWLADDGDRPLYERATRTIFAAQAVNFATKIVIRRARPALEDLPALSPAVSRLSHPSAHATTSFAGAGTLCEALPRGPLYAAAVAMALSRPYLGVHYPSDVVVGAMLGAVLARTAT
jgi:membrane-associated phospholipid phosphatase